MAARLCSQNGRLIVGQFASRPPLHAVVDRKDNLRKSIIIRYSLAVMRGFCNGSRCSRMCCRESIRCDHQRWRHLPAWRNNTNRTLLRRGFILHARRLQHVRPLSTCPSMTVLEMLPEVVRSEELLRLIAFAELVNMVKVVCSSIPLRWVRKLFAAITTHICPTRRHRCMESCLYTCKGGTGP